MMPSILKGLFITNEPLPLNRYIKRMALFSVIPSILMSAMITVLLNPSETDLPNFKNGTPADPRLLFFMIVFIGPAFETLLLSLTIYVLSFFIKKPWALALAA